MGKTLREKVGRPLYGVQAPRVSLPKERREKVREAADREWEARQRWAGVRNLRLQEADVDAKITQTRTWSREWWRLVREADQVRSRLIGLDGAPGP